MGHQSYAMRTDRKRPEIRKSNPSSGFLEARDGGEGSAEGVILNVFFFILFLILLCILLSMFSYSWDLTTHFWNLSSGLVFTLNVWAATDSRSLSLISFFSPQENGRKWPYDPTSSTPSSCSSSLHETAVCFIYIFFFKGKLGWCAKPCNCQAFPEMLSLRRFIKAKRICVVLFWKLEVLRNKADF